MNEQEVIEVTNAIGNAVSESELDTNEWGEKSKKISIRSKWWWKGERIRHGECPGAYRNSISEISSRDYEWDD